MKRMTFAAIVALMISFSPMAHATLARAVSFDEKVSSADNIVLGTCVRQHSTFDPSGRWIVTYSTFAVSKSYKGNSAPEVTIVTPGGSVGSLHQETVGVPHFGEGDVNVLFIHQDRVGPTVLFFDQGAYRVVPGADGGSLVAPVESGLVLIDDQTGQAKSTRDEGVKSLREFETKIDAVLQRMPERQMQ